jgi:hypothetical protein
MAHEGRVAGGHFGASRSEGQACLILRRIDTDGRQRGSLPLDLAMLAKASRMPDWNSRRSACNSSNASFSRAFCVVRCPPYSVSRASLLNCLAGRSLVSPKALRSPRLSISACNCASRAPPARASLRDASLPWVKFMQIADRARQLPRGPGMRGREAGRDEKFSTAQEDWRPPEIAPVVPRCHRS